MIKLCGFALSNYFNKTRVALAEKGVPHELDLSCFPSQDPAFKARTPMGKIPFLETEHGTLTESQIICEYLEDRFPEHPLYPRDAFERAKIRVLLQTLELHVELVARRLLPELLRGQKVSDEVKADVKAGLEKGVHAFASMAKFAPYLGGAEFTYADCAAAFHLPLISMATKMVLGHDALAGLPQIPEYMNHVLARPAVKVAEADRQAAFAAVMASRNK